MLVKGESGRKHGLYRLHQRHDSRNEPLHPPSAQHAHVRRMVSFQIPFIPHNL